MKETREDYYNDSLPNFYFCYSLCQKFFMDGQCLVDKLKTIQKSVISLSENVETFVVESVDGNQSFACGEDFGVVKYHLNGSCSAHASACNIGAVDISSEILLRPFDDVQDITLGVVIPDKFGSFVALGDVDVVTQPESGNGGNVISGVS